MRLAVATSKKKFKYGPIADAIIKSGIVELVSLEDQSKFHEYDHIIVFYNKVPIITNKPKGRIAWWMNDLRKPEELEVLSKYNFDDIFLCHKTYDDLYKEAYKKPLYFMPQCGHSQPREKGRLINWETVFIGKAEGKKYYHNDRPSVLAEIGKYTNLKTISGEGQTGDQCWIYNKSRYSLAMSFPMIEGTSNRLYNILASAGFCLVRYFPGIEKQFENKKHLVWFKDAKEAVELIQYYNENEDERASIAEAGFQQFVDKHTATKRLQNMFAIMQGEETKFRGYL